MFLAEMVLDLESALEWPFCVDWAEVHLFCCVCRVCEDFLRCPYDKDGSREFGFDEA